MTFGVVPGGVRRAGRRLAAPATAFVLGGLLLVLVVAEFPLAGLARQSLMASGGSLPAPFSVAFGAVGFVVAWRKPGNPLGWLLLGIAFFLTVSEAASFYAIADYRLHQGGLPLGWLALLAQPGWAPGITCLGLVILLFPDGRLPSLRWRWALSVYLAVGLLWVLGAVALTAISIAGHHTAVDAGGNLLALDHPAGVTAWWGFVQDLFFPVLTVSWSASLAGQVLSYRRSSGERRQQLKWLLGGAAACMVAGALVAFGGPGSDGIVAAVISAIVFAGFLALPLCIGVAILRYRLYEIDRIISRTLAYAVVTGLLVGVYALLVTVASLLVGSSPVVVAGSTLVVAGLFNPVRRRVQRVVDRRFNRARYDADRTVAVFASRMQDAIDLPTVRTDLLDAVGQALEPAHASIWLADTGRS